MAYVWHEAKRVSNLAKHKLDFRDAALVYESLKKVTLKQPRKGEDRKRDLALVEVLGGVLALAYVLRGENVRCISLRPASREEWLLYAEEYPE